MRIALSARVVLAAAFISGIFVGCGSETVPIVNVPQTQAPASVDPKTLPKTQRPGPNSSAGQNQPPNR